MPSRKPDPKCGDCKGTGQITLFTSSSECGCVNRQPSFASAIYSIKNFRDALDSKYENFVDPKLLERIKKLQLSANYIADGIADARRKKDD